MNSIDDERDITSTSYTMMLIELGYRVARWLIQQDDELWHDHDHERAVGHGDYRKHDEFGWHRHLATTGGTWPR